MMIIFKPIRLSFATCAALLIAITSPAQEKNTKLTGKITNANPDDYVEIIIADPADFRNTWKTNNIPLNNEDFAFEVNLKKPVEMRLRVMGKNGEVKLAYRLPDKLTYGLFLVEPGDQLRFRFKNETGYEIAEQITGNGSAKLICLQEISKDDNIASLWEFQPRNAKEVILYKEVIDSVITSKLSAYGKEISPLGRAYLKERFDAKLYRKGIDYINKYSEDADEQNLYKQWTTRFTNRHAYSLLKSTHMYDNEFIANILIEEDIKMRKRLPIDSPTAFYNLIQSVYKGEIKDFLLASHVLKRGIPNNFAGEPGKLAVRFLSETSKESPYYDQIKSIYQHTRKNLIKDADAFDFSLIDINDNIVTTENFKGKAMLLDFWFTGCPSCAGITPYLAQVEEMLATENITFISISVDSNKETWKRGIGNFSSPTAIALYTGGVGDDHPIIQHYQIKGFPRLILIDKNGKIISLDMPKPWKENVNEDLIAVNDMVYLIQNLLAQ